MTIAPLVVRGPAPEQFLGAGALRAAAVHVVGSRSVLVVDASIVDAADAAVADCPGLRPVARIVIDTPLDWDDVEAHTRIVRSAEAGTLVAIGGGNVIDAAKLAGWSAASASGALALRARARIGGLVTAPRVRRPLPLVCAPTTVGTGAEVSAVACCGVRLGDEEYKCLVGFEDAQVRAAAYDPALLRVPRPLLLAGIAEAWLRPLGAFVGASSATSVADIEALALIGRLGALAEQAFTAQGDLDAESIALASAASHTGWALRGRGIAPSPLWFIANELSMMATVTKMEATAAVLSGWLRQVKHGDAAWGDEQRLELALAASGCTGSEDLVDRVQSLVGGAPVAFDPRRLAERVVNRFGRGRPLPRGLTEDAILRMVLAAAPNRERHADAAS